MDISSARQGAVRPPAVAGLFYPSDAEKLRHMVGSFLDKTTCPPSLEGHPPVALIAPHAGYIYSGPIAASAYRLLVPFQRHYSRVVLIGPAHRVPFHGLAGASAESFATPLGFIPVDQKALEMLCDLPYVVKHDEAHAGEHSLEVHLPFLQTVLSDFKLVPLLASRVSAEDTLKALEMLRDGKTLFVISSDLSHYYDSDTARMLDDRTREAIERLSPGDISSEQACGRTPVQSLLLLAREKGWTVKTLDLRNSGDTAGSRREVVGYGAWAFFGS